MTQRAWIEALQEEKITVMVGGIMTHQSYIRSEGGYIDDDCVSEIYNLAVNCGVSDFVVPGNKPGIIRSLKQELETMNISPVFYSPGFITQGGSIEDAMEASDGNLHAFVGRALYEADNIHTAAVNLCSQLKVDI